MYTLLLAALLACNTADSSGPTGGSTSQAAAKRTDITIDAFAPIQAKGGITLVDVRTPREFSSGHVPGAINLPIGQLTPGQLDDHDKSQPVYVICAVGGRSSMAANKLAGAGFQAVNILGGTKAWQAAGHPVE